MRGRGTSEKDIGTTVLKDPLSPCHNDCCEYEANLGYLERPCLKKISWEKKKKLSHSILTLSEGRKMLLVSGLLSLFFLQIYTTLPRSPTLLAAQVSPPPHEGSGMVLSVEETH